MSMDKDDKRMYEYQNVEFIPVDSSNIEAIGYNSIDEILFVKFNSGGLYSYYRITPELFNNFLNAESKGKFFHLWIKNNKQYIYTKIL